MASNPEVELGASRALFAARMLVSAVHEPGPWTMMWGSVEVPADRVVDEHGVHFSAQFPDMCHLSPPTGGLALVLHGEVMGIRSIDHPGDTGFTVTWSIVAEENARSASC